jgi:hypothetical protein
MILGINGIVASSAFDKDYQAVLNYAITVGGATLPSTSQQIKQNKLVVDLKAAGIWQKLDTFGVFATDGNSTFARIDWIRLVTMSEFNSPTFTTNSGFKGNGTSAYIDTGFNSQVGPNYTLNNASFGYKLYAARTTTNAAENIYGNGNDGLSAYLRSSAPPRIYFNANGGFVLTTAFVFNTVQFVNVNRTSSTGVNIYGNGSLIETKSLTSSLISSSPFTVFKSGTVYTNAGVSIIYAGADMTSFAASFNTITNNYTTSL